MLRAPSERRTGPITACEVRNGDRLRFVHDGQEYIWDSAKVTHNPDGTITIAPSAATGQAGEQPTTSEA